MSLTTSKRHSQNHAREEPLEGARSALVPMEEVAGDPQRALGRRGDSDGFGLGTVPQDPRLGDICAIVGETWRFSDHRGIMPSDVTLRAGSLAARFTSSKTRGSDRDLTAHVGSCCFLARPSWPTLGLSLLVTFADVFGFTCCLIQRRTAAAVFSCVSAFRCSSEFCIHCGSVNCPYSRGAPLDAALFADCLTQCHDGSGSAKGVYGRMGVPKAVTDTVVWQGFSRNCKS